MPLPAIATAALTSGASSLASGLVSSIFGKKSKGPSVQEQIIAQGNSAFEQNYKGMEGRLKAATVFGKQYGIHPLAALGIPTTGGTIPQYDTGDIQGQNLGRAVGAAIEGYKNHAMEKLQLERAELENDLLRSQISNVNNQPGDPPAPVAGKVEGVPHRETSKRPNDSGVAAGLPPGLAEYDVGDGQKIILPYTEEGPGEAMENMSFPFNKIKEAEFWYKRYYKKTPGYHAAKIYKKLFSKAKKSKNPMQYKGRKK